MFAIEIHDVCIKHGARYILRDFSLSVNEGEKVLLNGSSGCGKSTVLKAISGLVVPCRGSISIYGQTLNGHDIWHIRRLMAYVQQEPELGTGSVKTILEQPFSYKANHALKKNLERLPELMHIFNFNTKLLDKDASTLSGGEKQRVAIISAILLDRKIILLDEASSALDKANKAAVAEHFSASGATILMASHDSQWVSFADRTVEMNAQDIEND